VALTSRGKAEFPAIDLSRGPTGTTSLSLKPAASTCPIWAITRHQCKAYFSSHSPRCRASLMARRGTTGHCREGGPQYPSCPVQNSLLNSGRTKFPPVETNRFIGILRRKIWWIFRDGPGATRSESEQDNLKQGRPVHWGVRELRPADGYPDALGPSGDNRRSRSSQAPAPISSPVSSAIFLGSDDRAVLNALRTMVPLPPIF